ncbi:hypothetical protein J2785_007264 [Burkholderia ambifaria]|nr:hypothetical protein [Burkholderia ambifaria]MDR6504070.1 hypothetical protein [Burkholderia ambifaria]
MARSNFSKLLDELDAMPHPITGEYSPIKRRNVDKTSAAGKVVRARSTLAKSLPDLMLKAGIDTTKLKPFTRKKAAKPAALPDTEDVPMPAKLRHEMLKQAIVEHAAAHDNLNSPISEPMLNRVLSMAKTGQLSNDQARRTVEHHSKGLALPTDVMRAIASNR